MSLIHEALPRIASKVGAIGKNRNNEQQKYKFRGIDDMYNALNGIMAEEGVFSVPEVMDIKREERVTRSGTALMYSILTVKYTLYAKDGSSVAAVLTGEGMDSGDKSCNKALAGAQKYLFLQVFAIPTEEPKDSEIDSHEVVAKKSPVQPELPPSGGVSPTPAPAVYSYTEEEKAAIQIICEWLGAQDLGSIVAPFGESKLTLRELSDAQIKKGIKYAKDKLPNDPGACNWVSAAEMFLKNPTEMTV